jgi:membrane protein implicated in regulation of membrane protease activity
MSARKIVGLVFVIAAFAIAPFAYWIGFGWGLVAVVLAVPGFMLLFFGRKARNSMHFDSSSAQPDAPPGHELQGFRGAAVLDSNDAVGDVDSGH